MRTINNGLEMLEVAENEEETECGMETNTASSATRCGFSTNRLYRAFEKYVAVKTVKLMRKLTMLHVGNTYNNPLQ